MDIKNHESFEALISEALQQEFTGWDFNFLADRWKDQPTSWEYARIVHGYIRPELTMLDMDTGGGEFLSSLQPLPRHTFATEGFVPNVTVARNRLAPLGVHVMQIFEDEALPFEDRFFDLVTNRHGSFSAQELYRIMKSGGFFITQQVGGENNFELNRLLQEQPEFKYSYWTLNTAARQLTDAGFKILEQKEEHPETVISDIGALVFYLKVVSWQIEDFSVEKYHNRLAAIHNRIEEQGSLRVKSHRFLIIARRN